MIIYFILLLKLKHVHKGADYGILWPSVVKETRVPGENH